MIRMRAGQIVVATGGWERPLVFEQQRPAGRDAGQRRSAAVASRQLPVCTATAVVVTDNAAGLSRRPATRRRRDDRSPRSSICVTRRRTARPTSSLPRTFPCRRGRQSSRPKAARHVSARPCSADGGEAERNDSPAAGSCRRSASRRRQFAAVSVGCKLSTTKRSIMPWSEQCSPACARAGAVNRHARPGRGRAGKAAARAWRPRRCGEAAG